MILLGIRWPKEATTPRSQEPWFDPTPKSLGRGQVERGKLCLTAYLATFTIQREKFKKVAYIHDSSILFIEVTKHGWGLGCGTTTDNSLTITPSSLNENNGS